MEKYPFDWAKYIKFLSGILLFFGIIFTLILFFTVCLTIRPYDSAEFSGTGFVITISVLLCSMIIHAILRALALFVERSDLYYIKYILKDEEQEEKQK